MKPITAFVMETVHELNISTFAELEEHTREQKKVSTFLWREKRKYLIFSKFSCK